MKDNIVIRPLTSVDLSPQMLRTFKHKQQITQKWVKNGNLWQLLSASELREWSDEKREWIPQYLSWQTERGGCAIGAFAENEIVGFGCVDGTIGGKFGKYSNFTMLFVDDDWKRKGIGKMLFQNLCRCAMAIGAEKVFISAIPSFETVAFYLNMGCVDAKEIIAEFIDTEQDRYLEYDLYGKK